MFNFIPRFIRCPFAFPLVFCSLFSLQLCAQTNPFNIPPARPGKLPLSAVVTNGDITFSWPAMPGKWELSVQQPAGVGDWKPISTNQYRTNGIMISATVPQPNETAYYRVKRVFGFNLPDIRNLPPVPPPPTNRVPPRLPKPPPHP